MARHHMRHLSEYVLLCGLQTWAIRTCQHHHSSQYLQRRFLAGVVIYLTIALANCRKMHVSQCFRAAAIAIGGSGRPGDFPRLLWGDDVDAKLAGKGSSEEAGAGAGKPADGRRTV